VNDSPWPAVDAFLAFVLRREPSTRADWPELVRRLDDLAVARHRCAIADYPEDDEGAPRTTDAELRPLIGQRFPEFGFYHRISPLVDGDLDFDQGTTLGDAIDDLLDITKDLQSAVWFRDRGRSDEGAALLAWSFDHHWGEHLRELQVCLHYMLRH